MRQGCSGCRSWVVLSTRGDAGSTGPAAPLFRPARRDVGRPTWPQASSLVRMPTPAIELEVGGRTLRVTSPDKLYFPEVGLTKRDVVEYVLAVGDGILAALRDRPVTMER